MTSIRSARYEVLKHYAPNAVPIVEGSKDAVCAGIAGASRRAELCLQLRMNSGAWTTWGSVTGRRITLQTQGSATETVDIIFAIAAYDWDEVGFSVMNRRRQGMT